MASSEINTSTTLNKKVVIPFSVLFICVVEVIFGFYVYQLAKVDFREELRKEVRNGVCKAKFKELLDQEGYLKHVCNEIVFNRQRQRSGVYRHSISKRGVNLLGPYLPTLPRVDPEPWCQSPGRPGGPGYPGLPGPKGPPGPKGDKGRAGAKGEVGDEGPGGMEGEKGSVGEKGLEGEKGIVGPPGSPGIRGETGKMGASGQKGETGTRGINGREGVKGEPGIPGVPGKVGKPGSPGAPGIDGKVGKVGPPGENGEPGINYCLNGPVGTEGIGLDGIDGQPLISR